MEQDFGPMRFTVDELPRNTEIETTKNDMLFVTVKAGLYKWSALHESEWKKFWDNFKNKIKTKQQCKNYYLFTIIAFINLFI